MIVLRSSRHSSDSPRLRGRRSSSDLRVRQRNPVLSFRAQDSHRLPIAGYHHVSEPRFAYCFPLDASFHDWIWQGLTQKRHNMLISPREDRI